MRINSARAVLIPLTLAVAVFGSPPATSQSQFRPTPIEASDPVRQKVDGLVRLLLAGNLAAATQELKANAVPGSPAATGADEQIQALKDTLGAGGYHLVDVVKGMMEGEVLVLTNKPNAGPAALLIRVETSAPYRIKGVQPMGMGRRSR